MHLFINGEISESTVDEVWDYVSRAKLINSQEIKDVYLIINSQGGCVSSTNAIINIFSMCPLNITTIGLSEVSSSALALYMLGNERLCYPNTIFLIHDASISLDSVRVDDVKGYKKAVEHQVSFHNKMILSKTNIKAKKLGIVSRLIR